MALVAHSDDVERDIRWDLMPYRTSGSHMSHKFIQSISKTRLADSAFSTLTQDKEADSSLLHRKKGCEPSLDRNCLCGSQSLTGKGLF